MRNKRRVSITEHLSNDYFAAMGALKLSSPAIVYVEGYEDISFWREIFDDWEDKSVGRCFEITTPSRSDRAKGKKVVLSFADRVGEKLILCVDSDFDYLLDGATRQSRVMRDNKYVIQTKLYAIENLQCLPETLSSIAAKATKNDMDLFDFERFCSDYSRALYPLFVWYFCTAMQDEAHVVPLAELKSVASVRYLVEKNNGAETVAFIARSVNRKVAALKEKYPQMIAKVDQSSKFLASQGVKEDELYLWVQGHFWKDNVVRPVLQSVCSTLKQMIVQEIENSKMRTEQKRNELSSYNNSLRDIGMLMESNTLYKKTVHYLPIKQQINNIFKVK